jgi:hypothetical protein
MLSNSATVPLWPKENLVLVFHEPNVLISHIDVRYI